MSFLVVTHVTSSGERFVTLRTSEWLHVFMYPKMFIQVSFVIKGFGAVIADALGPFHLDAFSLRE